MPPSAISRSIRTPPQSAPISGSAAREGTQFGANPKSSDTRESGRPERGAVDEPQAVVAAASVLAFSIKGGRAELMASIA